MIRILNIVDNDYEVIFSLRGEDGMFTGYYKIDLAFKRIKEVYGDIHWSDTLQWGFVFVNNDDDYQNYDVYLNNKRYTLKQFIEDANTYYEYLDNYFRSQDAITLLTYLYFLGLEDFSSYISRACDSIVYTESFYSLLDIYIDDYLKYIEDTYKITKDQKNEIKNIVLQKYRSIYE